MKNSCSIGLNKRMPAPPPVYRHAWVVKIATFAKPASAESLKKTTA
jgi:hypothetical protein